MERTWNYNIHSHTSRCQHAYGSDEEYAEHCHNAGFSVMGFSDHIFLPGIHQKGMRGDYSLLDEYVESVSSLKKKYEGKMEIHVGFEAEWYGDYFHSYYYNLLKSKKIEYLILGQHAFMLNGFPTFYASLADHEMALNMYTNDLIAGMRSGLFTYVCHPDLYVAWHHEWTKQGEEAAWKIAKEAKALNIPLEVNMGPSRWKGVKGDDVDGLYYPYAPFWEIVSEVGCDVVVGVDAHDPSNYEDSDYAWVMRFIEKHHLKLVKNITFPTIK